jgi:hypothetical protein
MTLIKLTTNNLLENSGKNVLIKYKDNTLDLGQLSNFEWVDSNLNNHQIRFDKYEYWLINLT